MEKQETNDSKSLAAKGNKIIRNHTLTAMGIGLVPVPILDVVGVTGAQMNMLRRLAQIYQVPFTEHKAKTIISSLLAGGGSVPIANVVSSLVKVIPVVGTVLGTISMTASAGATTYAVGKVFLMHFATGGTFLTFNPENVKAYFAEMLKEGKTVVNNLKS